MAIGIGPDRTRDLAQPETPRPVASPSSLATRRLGILGAAVWGLLLSAALVVFGWLLAVQAPLGIHDDELYSLNRFITTGPSGIWGHYVANDHMLYELLTWALRSVTGDHTDAVLRFWGAVPTFGAVALIAWWLWHSIDRYAATAFACLAALSPILVFLGGEGRGYGLCFLACALVIVSLDRYLHLGGRPWLAAASVGATIGIWTLPVFLLYVGPLAILLLFARVPRREVLTALAAVAIACGAFYLPVLGQLGSTTSQRFGAQLTGVQFLTAPLRDELNPTLQTLVPGIERPVTPLTTSIMANEIVDEGAPVRAPAVVRAFLSTGPTGVAQWFLALVVLSAVPFLLHARERFRAAMLLIPTVVGYLLVEFAGFYYAARFMSFVALPLLVLCAIGLTGIARSVARVRGLLVPVVIIGIAACGVTLVRAWSLEKVAAQSIDNYEGMAAVVAGLPRMPVLSNDPWGVTHYLPPGSVNTERPAELQSDLCSRPPPFAYVQDDLIPRLSVSTTCLARRGALRIGVANRREITRAVWILSNPAGT